MTLVTATFIANSLTGDERYVERLPDNYQFAPFERLITRQITEEEEVLLKNDNYKKIKVYRYMDSTAYPDKTIPPKGLDYKTGLITRLYEDPYINDLGFLETMNFYGKGVFNSTTRSWNLSDKIICEKYMYTIDPATKYVVARTKEISWYREDGTKHPDKKYMFKPYSILEMEEEAIRRRSNIISGVKIELAKFTNYLVSVQFPDPTKRPDSNELAKKIVTPFNTPIRNYIDAGDKDTLLKVLTSTTDPFFGYIIPWKGKPVRQFIQERIS